MTAQNKSLLVVKYSGNLTGGQYSDLQQWIKPLAEKMGAEGVVISEGMDVAVQHDLQPLVDVIAKQVAAINRLATSNEMLVQAMAESEGVEDLPPRVGLNGKPL